MPKTPSKHTTLMRSFRLRQEAWERARERATEDGVTPSRAATLLVEGYADGKYALPVEGRQPRFRGRPPNATQ